MSRLRLLATVVTTALALGLALAVTPTAVAADEDQPNYATPPRISMDDARRQSAIVAAEDRRLTQVRTVAALARWQNKNWKTPYRLSTGGGYTLVLTASSEPYRLDDLLRLQPQTLVRMPDGAYVLTEHIVVMAGATLVLTQPGGLKLRLASGTAGFSTIVAYGGKLDFTGTEGARTTITSWDEHAGKPDTNALDGRAYVRAIGGQFSMQYTDVRDLGFWSGRTGGIALTGTDRPNSGAIESVGKAKRTGGEVPTVTDDLGSTPISPAGVLPPGAVNPDLRFTVPTLSYVSGKISHSTFTGNAVGLFVSGANGVQVSDSTVRDSQIAGVQLHRFVTNGVIQRTTSTHNGGDGFALARATQGIVISESTASLNAGNGFTLSGRPLADGPSAVGSPLDSYGNNSVSNSTAKDNARDGIEVIGGFNIGVQNNRVEGNDMGVVVSGAATRVAVTGNQVSRQHRHAIALVNGVDDSTVTGNVIAEATTGVYLRDAQADVKGNTVEDATVHGISLVHGVDGSEVAHNVLAGRGLSALDLVRADGDIVATGNQDGGWHDTSPWYVQLKRLLQPMTLLWVMIFGLLLVSAVRSRKHEGGVTHPYAHQMSHHHRQPAPHTIDVRDEVLQGASA
jgi:hypothetical protein